ncbi:MAG: aminotransferase class III-fold pyridoxal phosphate-dependent enzyme, partial [Gammaproteobacteria bacterium]|nr:aminotransferase class III-fold pyridoxal phosphate-dependent enzyme [Gammaproteobacteria bacterium]
MASNPELTESLLEQAHRVLPGGSFGNTPAELILREGRASRVWDEDGNEYVDYLIGSGPMLVGHGHPDVNAAIESQLAKGTTFFANNRQGIDLATVICEAVPCADKVRFASTGSEADAFAMRLARAYRGRDKILKFEGGYHGYSDYGLMSLAPSKPGNASEAIADSAGIPVNVKENMLVAPFNDVDAVASLIREHKDSIAAVFMEPLQRLIPPRPGFLEAMRELTEDNDILLVFDEVVTGFRMAYGGAQEHYGVTPDICTLGKAIGGGFPLSAIAGREDIMALFDKSQTTPDRFVPQVGTLSGNPIAAAAGLATLEVLSRPGTYEAFFATGQRLMDALSDLIAQSGFAGQVVGAPPMFDVVFADGDIRTYRDTQRADVPLLTRLNAALRERGILKGENKYYLSTTIDERD